VLLNITDLKHGMVLAEDVYDEAGELILSTGATLNDALIARLERRLVQSVIIKNIKSDKQVTDDNQRVQEKYSKAVERFKSLYTSLKLGENLVYTDIEDVAAPLVEEVANNQSLTRQLWQIKTCDLYTFDHSVMVSIVSAMLAKWLKLSGPIIKDAAVAGLLHDIGKINIPDEILNKPAALTREEYNVMKTHPRLGYILLSQNKDVPKAVLDGVQYHHERVDGSGYPDSLSGNGIPILAKIVAIADVFSAMTTKRVYKDAVSPFKVAKEMIDAGFKNLEAEYIHTFINGVTNYYVGSSIKLSTGEQGVIVMVNKQSPNRPLIKLRSGYLDLLLHPEVEIEEIMSEDPKTI